MDHVEHSMPGTNPKVYIVTLTWNHKSVTKECLESVFQLDYRPYQVVVVDNGSEDGTVELIRRQFPAVELIALDENVGFGRGMNKGIECAIKNGAEFVFVLNNDTIVPPDLLSRLVRFGQQAQHRGVGLFVPKICYWEPKSMIWSAGARWRHFPPMVTIIGFRSADGPRYDRPCEVEFATGCAMLIRRQALERVGFFDPRYFMYYEDYDLCQRFRDEGYRIWYVPEARLWHKVSISAGEGSTLKWRYWARSAVHFYHRFFAHPKVLLLIVSLWVFLRELAKGHIAFVQPYCQGLRHGLAEQAAMAERCIE